MSRYRLVIAIGIFNCQFDLALGQAGSGVPQSAHIRTVSSDTISDLALAIADPKQPVIYYNPRLMARFGPEISAFVLAHERAHIELGHARPQVGWAGDALEHLLQSWELEADCRAAARLARERPSALLAAISFFEHKGLERVDREHPTGSARSAQLSACGRMLNGDLRSANEGPRTSATTSQFR